MQFVSRRTMLRGSIATIGATTLPNWFSKAAAAAELADSANPGASVKDETFWHMVAQAYDLDYRHIVLNGGGNNPLPRTVVNALCRFQRMAASQPRPHNFDLVAYNNEHRVRLARLMGCDVDELSMTRGTTEGLNIVAWGLPLQAGDEVLMSQYDALYGAKIFGERAKRHGIVVKVVDLPLAPSIQEVVDGYAAALTGRTKLLVASDIAVDWGFVLPIRELSELAHANGAQILVDGALSFGHMPINVKEYQCDYYATSLHKWLNAPLGTGALYVRRDRLEDLWPLYGVNIPPDNIRKFEVIGTRDGAPIAAVGPAIDLYERIGPERKLARLKFLLDELTSRLDGVDGVTIYTEPDPNRRVAYARIVVDGFEGTELWFRLRDEEGIWTYGNYAEGYAGIYVSPNVFNTPAEMAFVAETIKRLARA